MTPDSEAELKANIHLLLELVREQQGTLRELQGAFREQQGSLREQQGTLREQQGTLREHSAMLREQGARLNALAEDVAWVKAHIANLPQPAEFYELRGRVEEISRRLPTTIAYVPPPPATRKDPAE